MAMAEPVAVTTVHYVQAPTAEACRRQGKTYQALGLAACLGTILFVAIAAGTRISALAAPAVMLLVVGIFLILAGWKRYQFADTVVNTPNAYPYSAVTSADPLAPIYHSPVVVYQQTTTTTQAPGMGYQQQPGPLYTYNTEKPPPYAGGATFPPTGESHSHQETSAIPSPPSYDDAAKLP